MTNWASLPISDGRHIVFGDQTYILKCANPDGAGYILTDRQGLCHLISRDEFNLAKSENRVSDGKAGHFENQFPTSNQRDEKAFRKAIIERVQNLRREGGYSWVKARDICLEEMANKDQFPAFRNRFPACRTIQHWVTEQTKFGDVALHDRRCNSGNRTDRHDQDFAHIVEDLLEQYYRASDRWTVTHLHKVALGKYHEHCKQTGATPGPCGRRIVESIVDAIPSYELQKNRLGSADARKKMLTAVRQQICDVPLGRVEIDSTEADIFVLIGENDVPIRPWITMAIDVATGFILGLTCSTDRPNHLTTVETIVEAMKPKDQAFFDLHDIDHPFQAYGDIDTVVTDQGSENSGYAITRLIKLTGIEFQRTIPGHPEKKPFIERAFRTLSEFLMTQPGASKTRARGNEKRTTIALKEAAIPFDEFCSIIQKWRYDVYATRPRRRIHSPLGTKESPRDAWARIASKQLIAEPLTGSQLHELLFQRQYTRKLQHYGIEINQVQYHSDALAQLYRTFKNTQVEVLFNPLDVRSILVRHPNDGSVIRVPTKDPDFPALNEDQLKNIAKQNPLGKSAKIDSAIALAAIEDKTHQIEMRHRSKLRKRQQQAKNERADRKIADATPVQPITSKHTPDAMTPQGGPASPVSIGRRISMAKLPPVADDLWGSV